MTNASRGDISISTMLFMRNAPFIAGRLWSQAATHHRGVLAVAMLVLQAACVSAAPIKYSVIEFPDPPGHQLLTPADINDKGEVVFRANTIGTGTRRRMFIYLPAPAYGLPAGMNMIDYAGQSVEPRCINDLGQVGGWMTTVGVVPSPTRGFLWENGVFTQEFNMDAPGDNTTVRSINEAGYIAGTYEVPKPGSTVRTVIRGFVRTTNDFIILNPVNPTTNHTYAIAINNSNHVAGYYETLSTVGWERGFFWNGTLAPLGTAPVDEQTFQPVHDFNDASEIAGIHQTTISSPSSPYLWLPAPKYGLPAGLNILPFVTGGEGVCLNNSGQVATPTHLWLGGITYPMSELLPAGLSTELSWVVAMNNRGQIVGFRKGADGAANRHAILLTPGTNDAIIVNVTSDDADADPNDGIIDVDLNAPDQQISLRAAINYANSTNRPGPDTIEFDIEALGAASGPAGSIVITPTNALPEITEPLSIDGTTQPGSGRVGLNGSLAGMASGLRLVASNCLVRGLSIQQFQRAGILIQGGHSHVIKGNLIGTDTSGAASQGNGIGILIENSASNIIGGFNAADRNIVSANLTDGIAITNSSGIELRANFVGTTPDGAASLVNGGKGLMASQVSGLSVGTPGIASVINSAAAAVLRNVNVGQVVNCLVGLNANGDASLAGTVDGIEIEQSSDFNLGGTSRNILGGISSVAVKVLDSTNVQVLGNFIGTDRTGNASIPVGTGVVAERSRGFSLGSAALNVICATNGAVFRQLSSFGTNVSKVLNCNFGVGANGNNKLGDMINGLFADRSEDLGVGGTARNVFGGISSIAITVLDSTNVQMSGNYIGTDRNGNTSVPVGTGILSENSRAITVGSSNALSVICATNGAIFRKVTSVLTNVSGVLNTHFGVGANGTSKVGNMLNGLIGEQSEDLVVGGTSRNVFGGIASNAIALLETTNVQVAANYIGTDRNGNTSLPVSVGIFADKVRNIAVGVTNALSVICATNGAVLHQLSGLSNTLNNVFFGMGTNGTAKLGNMVNGVVAMRSSGLRLGETARNIFAGISSNGISLHEVTNALLAANFIGTDRMGNASVPVGLGLFAEKVKDITIGVSNSLTVISATNGALLRELSGLSNTLNNCFFGLAANGTNKVGNMRNGLIAERSTGLNLGGVARNVFAHISSNAVSFQAVTNVKVLANLLGTDTTGLTRAPIGGNGITAVASRDLTVGNETSGGTLGRMALQIGACARHGLEAVDSSSLRVVNSIFGTDSSGTRSLSNSLSAVKVHFSSDFAAIAPMQATAITGNTIAFNGGSGVEITQDPAIVAHEVVHVIQGNSVRNNSRDGIRIGTNVSSVLIGGTNLAGANEITRNGGSGISKNGVGQRFFVEINSILSNSVKAIERASDPLNQVAPIITSAVKGSTHVQGNVSGQPNQTVRLHFYAHRPKAGAQGEGEMWVGTVNVPLNGAGVGSYNSVLPRTSPAGWLVASTAADPIRGTSEFSNSQMVQLPTDTDGDGLPDFWEALYPSCLDPLVPDPPIEDCDGDGFTNPQEYIAHTDPTRADSALRVENLLATGDGATLEFTGVAGRQYGLERRTDLGNGAWVRVAITIPEADGEVTLSDPEPPTEAAYYRIVAEFP